MDEHEKYMLDRLDKINDNLSNLSGSVNKLAGEVEGLRLSVEPLRAQRDKVENVRTRVADLEEHRKSEVAVRWKIFTGILVGIITGFIGLIRTFIDK